MSPVNSEVTPQPVKQAVRVRRGAKKRSPIESLLLILGNLIIVSAVLLAAIYHFYPHKEVLLKAITKPVGPWQEITFHMAKGQQEQYQSVAGDKSVPEPVNRDAIKLVKVEASTPGPAAEGTVKRIKGWEPQHLWDEATQTCEGLTAAEDAALTYFETHKVEVIYWTGGKARIVIPRDLYCYTKEAEIASGLPYWVTLGIGHSESPVFKHHKDKNWATASCWLQIIDDTWQGAKHKADAVKTNKRDCTYGGVNHMIGINMHLGINDETTWVEMFATPPVWNLHYAQAHEAWKAGQAIKHIFEMCAADINQCK